MLNSIGLMPDRCSIAPAMNRFAMFPVACLDKKVYSPALRSSPSSSKSIYSLQSKVCTINLLAEASLL